MYEPKIGEVVWYRTGNFTASRVRVLDVVGVGATRRAVVYVIDRMPDEIETTQINRYSFPKTGGLPVSLRSLCPLTVLEQRELDLVVAAYESGPLEDLAEE
jgi:hypothetical protein